MGCLEIPARYGKLEGQEARWPVSPSVWAAKCSKGHPRLPEWITKERVKLGDLHGMKKDLRDSHLHTVCEEARCPNRTHCFTHGTATFLLMGEVCTRACGFCSIQSGKPRLLDPHEPQETAERVAALEPALRRAHLREPRRPAGRRRRPFRRDRPGHPRRNPGVGVEVLVPDFLGDLDAVARVVAAGPAVFNHNTETVPSLYPEVRPAGRFERSLRVLRARQGAWDRPCTGQASAPRAGSCSGSAKPRPSS